MADTHPSTKRGRCEKGMQVVNKRTQYANGCYLLQTSGTGKTQTVVQLGMFELGLLICMQAASRPLTDQLLALA